MAVIDLQGFVADLKDHVAEHGFHVHDERHFIETYTNRQTWEVDLHPDRACDGPLDMHFALEVCTRALVMNGGVVVADGPVHDILGDEPLLRANRLEPPYGYPGRS